MEVNFGQYFIINLELNESELHDLLVELEDLSKNNENEKYETLIRFRKILNGGGIMRKCDCNHELKEGGNHASFVTV